MDRSSGFGSTTCNIFIRAINTRFRSGSVTLLLNLLHIVTRRPVLQKVRHNTYTCVRCALSACKHTVSGSFSLPSRGAFHLSLTVLYSIGHMVVFSLRRWSSVLPSGFLVSRCTLDTLRLYSISCTGLLPSSVHLSKCVLLSSSVLNRVLTLHILLYEVWALPISLATTFRIDFSFFSCG